MTFAPRDPARVQQTYWIVLGRAASALELANQLGGYLNSDQPTLLHGLLSSPEFRAIHAALEDGREAYGDPAAREASLRSLGPNDLFVRRALESLLCRPADDEGMRHYTQALADGERRANVVRALALSDEFYRRWRGLPRDSQLCELANPAKWDNDEWLAVLRGLGLSDDKVGMHRKPYELAQLVYGCRRLGALHKNATIVSIGAGHELVLYWLANHARLVVATDMYEGIWGNMQGREGDPGVLHKPEQYAPFPYRREALTFVKMDGRQAAFRDASFDIAYSLSSIEHFGGLTGAVATVREMARVLKPGGILAIATEYVLAGPPHPETFQPDEIAELIRQPGLELVQPIDTSVYRRYAMEPVDLIGNPYQWPHMVVRFGDTVFTTVMMFLRRTEERVPGAGC